MEILILAVIIVSNICIFLFYRTNTKLQKICKELIQIVENSKKIYEELLNDFNHNLDVCKKQQKTIEQLENEIKEKDEEIKDLTDSRIKHNRLVKMFQDGYYNLSKLNQDKIHKFVNIKFDSDLSNIKYCIVEFDGYFAVCIEARVIKAAKLNDFSLGADVLELHFLSKYGRKIYLIDNKNECINLHIDDKDTAHLLN